MDLINQEVLVMKKVSCALICFLVFAFLSGCENSGSNSENFSNSEMASTTSIVEIEESGVSQEEEVAVNSEKEITDINGDKVVIPENIERVICRSGNGTSFMVAMGYADKLVGTADYVVTNPWADKFCDGISSLPVFGWSPSSEEIYAVGADLVMVADPEVASALRTDGIPAICYKQYNEQEIVDSAELLGELFGDSAKEYSEEWLQYYTETNEYISEKIGNISEDDKPVVYYVYGQSNKGLGRTAGGDSIIQFLIEGAGGKFSTADLPNDGPKITEEDAISRNPDVIMISGIYSAELKSELENSPEWSQVTAVSENQVYQMPIGFISWDFYGVEYPLLKLWIAKQLYPDLIDKDLHEETKAFHEKFYGVDFSDEEIDYILNALSPDGTPYEN